jgi:outer membrane protein assembly factor BamD (BamD/ComL family)
MSTSAPLDPQTSGGTPAGETPAAPNFELTLRKFWEKNAKVVYLAIATVIVVILAQGGLKYFRASKEKDIASAYAKAISSEQLKTFASQHPDHVLGAAAQLRLADEAYAAGKYSEAGQSYEKAAKVFKAGPFGGRALIGAALSKVMSGQTADGEAKLKQVADDANQPKIIRAEAAYHRGTLALDAGRTEDAVKEFDLVSTLDPMSSWAQRAMMARSTLPAPAAASTLVPTTVKP